MRLTESGVSRRHAWFELSDEAVLVCDDGSRNGVYVNGELLEPGVPRQVERGQVVGVGESSIVVRMLGAKESSAVLVGLPFLPRDEFELLGEAGRGGLATVWAARQKYLDRMVAIKVLHPQRDPDLGSVERFLREARLYTKVKSPHVVELFDVRRERGQLYLILELVTGSDLRSILKNEVLTVPRALKAAEDVAKGLAAMHALGIVHRDVKPGNILITRTGKAKLGDLGLAKRAGEDELTHPGQGLGTMSYVPPEQSTDARSVSFKADLYSLGATLYHLIAGSPPLSMKRKSVAEQVEVLHAQVPKPLTLTASDCPQPVAQLVAALLAKDPSDRPGTAKELADTLRDLRRTHFPEWVPPEASVTRKTGALNVESLGVEVG